MTRESSSRKTSRLEQLPKWADHPGHDKTEALSEPGPSPEPILVDWLAELQRKQDRPLRILDVGAGRGSFVAWLCAQGYDAHGVEPNGRYIENSRAYFNRVHLGNRIHNFGPHGSYPFEKCSFDVVHSNQVVEHVRDINAFAREISRVTRQGGRGVHIFPAKWEPIEGHMHMPFVHWFPKGPARRMWINLALKTGQAAPYFADLRERDRVEVFQRFSEEETFYRTSRKVSRVFDQYGMDSDRCGLATAKLNRLKIPSATVARLAAPMFVALREAYITTVKR